MIVDPDFSNHWKTQMLCGFLSDMNAGMYLIRLWSHCQVRKCSVFKGMCASKLAAVCCWRGEPEVFLKALVDAEWVHVLDDALEVHEWLSYNITLHNSWNNGVRGGRPCKSVVKQISEVVQDCAEKPMGSPWVSHGVTDREEKRRNIDMCAFDRFWAVYPKKTAKAVALKAWKKGKCDGVVDAIVAAVDSQARSRQWKQGIIPHASTWLNQRRWEDELGQRDLLGERELSRDAGRGGNGLDEFV